MEPKNTRHTDRMTRGRRSGEHTVYLEVGDKRVFAGAIDWPAWARSGRDEDAALEALFAYARRYARALKGTRLGFEVPEDPSALRVVERLPGTATTDFGAPDVPPSADAEPSATPICGGSRRCSGRAGAPSTEQGGRLEAWS
jgi:hypothetical protein